MGLNGGHLDITSEWQQHQAMSSLGQEAPNRGARLPKIRRDQPGLASGLLGTLEGCRLPGGEINVAGFPMRCNLSRAKALK